MFLQCLKGTAIPYAYRTFGAGRLSTRNTFCAWIAQIYSFGFCQWPLDSFDTILAIPPER